MPRSWFLLVMALAGSAILPAAPLYVSASGHFSSTDVAGPLVSPNGVFSLSFALDSNPLPISGSVTTVGFDPPTSDFHFFLNGIATAVSPSEIRFNTSANGGLFDLTVGSGLTASEFSFQGAQAFSGSTSAPAFTAAQYAISSWTFSDPNNFDVQNPLGASISITPAPEPGSLATVLSGLFGVVCLLRRRRT